MKKLYDENGKKIAELNYNKEYFKDYSKHSHDSFVISFFTKGEIEVEFHNQSKQSVSVGEIITFNPYQVHQTKSKTKKTFDYYSLYVDEQWCKDIQARLFIKKDSFLSCENILKDKSLYDELNLLLENVLKDKFDYEKFEELLTILFERYTILELEKNEEHFLCEEVKKFISKNLNEQITLEDISKAVGYNESYITRVFKNYSGLTPYAYLVNKRVQEAKNIIAKDKKISLAQLSSEVGFYDQSHFSKAFKRTFATTPNKYKDS